MATIKKPPAKPTAPALTPNQLLAQTAAQSATTIVAALVPSVYGTNDWNQHLLNLYTSFYDHIKGSLLK
jgi:hypothetical protein